MKKFFYIVSILFTSAAASAQDPEQFSVFVRDRFPAYMVDYVFKNIEIVAVDEDYAKQHKKEKYQYSDLKGLGTQNSLRIGDTLLVFNDQPFYSKGQGMYMIPVVEEKVAKQKRQKREKSPEEKQRNQETLARILGTVVPGVINRVGGGSVGYQPNMIY